MNRPTITIVIPCRNERQYIEATVSSILEQQNLTEELEIIIADGRSDDGTREILDQLAANEPRLKIIDNPEKIVSTGLNYAIRAAQGEIIVRMDAHTEFAPDYVKQCIHVLESIKADNVGGPWQAKGQTFLQKAIALAFQSVFSSGGAGSHRREYEGPVDSVYLGCWHKKTILRIGLFDEELVRNQDDELNLRISRAGGTIWQSPSIRSWYYPRSSLLTLFKQYVQYGYWKVRVIQKHRIPASIRHIIPGGFVGTLMMLAVLSPVFSWAWPSFLGILGLYLCVNFFASLIVCRQTKNWKFIPLMPLIFICYHFGYGWGFLKGIIDFIIIKRGAPASLANLTR